jgi:hypothetical protein
MKKIIPIGCFLLLLPAGTLLAQDLGNIKERKALTVSGALSANQIFYHANGIDARRDPYTYFLSGNLNFDLYGWSIPLSFTYSNQEFAFQQPFNQYGIHPTYKWLRGHLGYISMNFSPYTLAGHIFYGAGLEANPSEKWSVSMMYGRLQKAVEPDSTETAGNLPAFKRMGYGFKVSYRQAGDFADLIFFKAADQINSIAYVPEALQVLPQENLVMSLALGKRLFEKLDISMEVANSGITRDTRATQTDGQAPISWLGPLYTPRTSTGYYQAWKTAATYRAQGLAFGFAYERVDPEYRTLGAYFFNNDLENITANANTALLQGKMNLGANLGVQRNNLEDDQMNTMRRLVGSANLNYSPSEKLNLDLSYSSFQTFTNIQPRFEQINQLTPYDNLDTLNFTQISRSANLMAAYVLSDDPANRQNLTLNVNFQDAADEQGNGSSLAGTQFYNLNTAWQMNLSEKQLSLSTALNYSLDRMDTSQTVTLGPTLALSKAFAPQLRANLSGSFNRSYFDGRVINSIYSLRLTGSYTWLKSHNFNLSVIQVSRDNQQESSNLSFTEFTVTLGYGYNFSTANQQKKDKK